MFEKELTTIGLDPANSFMKLFWNGEPLCYYNTVIEMKNSKMNSGLANMSEYPVFGYNGKDYLIGVPSGFGSGGIDVNRYGKPEYKREVLFAVSQIVSRTNEKTKIVTGVPCYHFDSDTIAENIKHNLIGKHEVTVDGVKKKFEIAEVVVLAQPMGTIFAKFFGRDKTTGEIYQKVADEELMETYCIFDIGWGTTDLVVINLAEGGVIKYDTLPIAMKEATSNIEETLNRKKPELQIKDRFKSIYELDSKLRGGHIKVGKTKYNLQPIISSKHSELLKELKQRSLNKGFTLDSYYQNVFTGGGSIAMKESLEHVFGDNTDVQQNAQMSNAEGFFYYGEQQ